MARTTPFTTRDGMADVGKPGTSVSHTSGAVALPANWSGIFDVYANGADVYVSYGTDAGGSGHHVLNGTTKSFHYEGGDGSVFINAAAIVSFWK